MNWIAFILSLLSEISGPWARGMWRASLDGTFMIVTVWLMIRLLPRTPPRVQCWLWRASWAKIVFSLFSSTAIVLTVLPHREAGVLANYLHPQIRAASSSDLSWATVLLVIWTFGVGLTLLGIVAALRLRRRLQASAILVGEDESIAELLKSVCHESGVSRHPALQVSSIVQTPMLVGIFRPAVILPLAFQKEVSSLEMRMVLAHEVAHVRRWDLAWNWLSTLVGAVFFFHPLVWFARNRLATACEAACDEACVAACSHRVPAYLNLLLRITQDHPRRIGPRWASAQIVGSYASLRQRFLSLQSIAAAPKRRRQSTVVASTLCCVAFLPWHLTAQRSAPAGASPVTAEHSSTGSGQDHPPPAVPRRLHPRNRRVLYFRIFRGPSPPVVERMRRIGPDTHSDSIDGTERARVDGTIFTEL